MAVKRTKSQQEQTQVDLKKILAALYRKFQTDNPAWAAALPQELKDAITRVLAG